MPRQTLFQNIRNTGEQILSQTETQITQFFLYGNGKCNFTINRFMNSTIENLISTERFKCSLFKGELKKFLKNYQLTSYTIIVGQRTLFPIAKLVC